MRGEFDFIQNIKEKYDLKSVGDDCAVLPKDEQTDMLVTADMLVEDVDFRLEWTTPELLGHKALAVSLSDVAAMGGEPRWSMVSLGLPRRLWETDLLDGFYNGWSALAVQIGVELVGGDISRTSDKAVVDSIVGGEVPRGTAVLRSGAKAGDAVFVTGNLGAAAGGLKLIESGRQRDKAAASLIERQLRPVPRLATGRLLRENGIATSMIDLSDGLSSDIHHICRESAVGVELDVSQLPIHTDLTNLFSPEEILEFALNGGEDFELLFTVPQEKIHLLDKHDVTPIGIITDTIGSVLLRTGDDAVSLSPSGYRHF